MRTQLTNVRANSIRPLLTATLALAITFTLSCSSGNNNDGGSGGGGSCNIEDYKTVPIGTQQWMAKNLNCNVSGSVCYNNDPANCDTYGRLYNWTAAKTVCPTGWHLPSDAEWDALITAVGGPSTAGTKL
jgi:hypothetical protein